MRTLSSRIGDWQLPRLHMWKERQLELRAEPRPLVGPDTRVATIGSCFASELAKAMDRLGLRGAMHPAGLFYTSRSIRQELAHVFGESSAQRDEALWTTAAGLVHPFKDYSKAFASEAELRYGGIAINCWSGLNYGPVNATWGAFPGHPLDDIESGQGVVHNGLLLDHPQKSVVRAPFVMQPTPAWFTDHKNNVALGKLMTQFERKPSLLGVPKVALTALKG